MGFSAPLLILIDSYRKFFGAVSWHATFLTNDCSTAPINKLPFVTLQDEA
jgi:hypothetical protein